MISSRMLRKFSHKQNKKIDTELFLFNNLGRQPVMATLKIL